MPRRTLLSSEQHTRLFGIPVHQAEMAKHYMLSMEDLALIRAKRRATNRLGFAIQLCALRYPGRALNPVESPPAPMLSFVASQLNIDSALFADYAHRDETRREHLVELQKVLRIRSLRLND
jgi:TnpA family transposase